MQGARWICLGLSPGLLCGCASVQTRWESAKELNTANDYQEFIASQRNEKGFGPYAEEAYDRFGQACLEQSLGSRSFSRYLDCVLLAEEMVATTNDRCSAYDPVRGSQTCTTPGPKKSWYATVQKSLEQLRDRVGSAAALENAWPYLRKRNWINGCLFNIWRDNPTVREFFGYRAVGQSWEPVWHIDGIGHHESPMSSGAFGGDSPYVASDPLVYVRVYFEGPSYVNRGDILMINSAYSDVKTPVGTGTRTEQIGGVSAGRSFLVYAGSSGGGAWGFGPDYHFSYRFGPWRDRRGEERGALCMPPRLYPF